MKKKCLLTMMAFALSMMAFASGIERNGNKVVVTVDHPSEGGAKVVCLEVVNDRIIRVRATAESQLPVKPSSLMIVPQSGEPEFTVEENPQEITVKAKKVSAVVRRSDGHIEFFDSEGEPLLSELADGGKTFKPFTVPEREIGDGKLAENHRHGWTWHLQFDSPSDESFYGLGQHQSEDFNYKGVNEELFQYNTKVSVPFVVSNRNYGILWDSYSYCRWGNPDDYQQLNRAFKLYDKSGVEGGLTGTYIDPQGKELVRREDSLYFEFAVPDLNKFKEGPCGIDNLPKDIKLDGAKVTYEGYLEAPVDNNYHFILYYAGYMRVLLDGKEVVPVRWRTAWNPNAWKFEYPLVKGKKTPIRIEWEPDGGESYCGLRAATPRTEEEQGRLSIWSEMSQDMDYYFISGGNLDEVISGYRTLTGKAPVYPKWVLGYWQSRERYKTQQEIEETLGEFRKRHIPVDNIVQDWNYWKLESWGDHTFEKERFPNPQQMLDNVHKQHGRFMISVWPKFYNTVENYKELDRHGWIYHQAVTDSIHDWLGFMGSFYDAYDPEARKVFWRQMDENLYSKYKFGIDAWWMDASEPNVRDCTPMWYRKALSGPTALGSSTEYFNAYSIVNADAIYNGQRSVNPNQRVFLLTRSGFAGEQRYSTATWSGDIGTRWEDMRAQMTAGLNYSLAGLPFWGMDQGGFSVEKRYASAQQIFDKTGVENADLTEWRELQTRWNQFGCFIPLYRAHGQWPLREPWNIAPAGHPAYETILYYDRLRYRLMPYLYSMAGWVHLKDYTMMRGLVMDFNGDKEVENIPDQWMFGPSLMACPVGYYKARSREVYFPKQCGWYDLYSGRHQQGGQRVTVDAPYERIPVFVPEGAIIPFGPSMEWSDEKPADRITLYVYAGRDGSFELYEDEGTNYNYEKGAYSTIRFSYDDKKHTLTIGTREGQFNGMLQSRQFNIVYVTPQSARALDLEKVQGKQVTYTGKQLKVKL